MNYVGKSGCFRTFTADKTEPAAEVVEERIQTTAPEEPEADPLTPELYEESDAAAAAVVGIIQQMVRRVRILTWAVVAITVVMLLREAE